MTPPKFCDHDCEHAIQISPVDYFCPKCKELIDPLEWFFLSRGVKFIDVTPRRRIKKIRKSIITKQNFLPR